MLDLTVSEGLSYLMHLMMRKARNIERSGFRLWQNRTKELQHSQVEKHKIQLSKNYPKEELVKQYILDEPTTGLHFHDIKKLIEVIQRLVNNGNTVIVIEHNIDVIKVSDYVIDLGPEGGDKGGKIVGCGHQKK